MKCLENARTQRRITLAHSQFPTVPVLLPKTALQLKQQAIQFAKYGVKNADAFQHLCSLNGANSAVANTLASH